MSPPHHRHYVLGVDPGDKHVGLADWYEPDTTVACYEVDADRALDVVASVLELAVAQGYSPTLVVETYQLYEDKAMAQTGSSMETSQMIGALKYIARRVGATVAEQGAPIKAAMRAQLPARGIKLAGSIHAKDAGLHLCHYVLFNNLGLRRAPGSAPSGSQ